jgi:UDP-glucose 4-epimerase
MSIAVVGGSSFIGQALQALPQTAGWRFIDRHAALESDAWLEGVACLLNCAFDSGLKAEPYSPERDVDLQLANRLQRHPRVRYLMLSSRMVYGPASNDGCLHEALQPQPLNLYGRAKWTCEQALRALLGDRLTVLRLSNVCGYELVSGRRSFFAMAMASLRDQGRIVLDMSPFVERDFLPVEDLVEALVRIAERPQAGLFNLGAGHGVACGRVAQWLIEGYGSGELRVNNFREYDPFWLDIRSASEAYGFTGVSPALLRDYCLSLGRRLRTELEVGQ